MSIETWGTMPKAQDDAETPEEMTARLIAAHEADPEAHLGTGESLETHRSQEMVDHLAGSIAIDKLTRSRLLMSSFDSIDGWTQYVSSGAQVIADFGSVTLSTNNVNGTYAGMAALPSGLVGFSASKDCFWRSTLRLAQTTAQQFYFGIGYLVDLVDFNGFGFKVVDNNLYAYMGDYDHFVETQILDVTLTAVHTYEIRFDVSLPKVEFYIDGVLVATYTTGYFPTDSDQVSSFLLETTANAKKYAYIFNMLYQQDF